MSARAATRQRLWRLLLVVPMLVLLAGCSKEAPPPAAARPVLTRLVDESAADSLRTYSGDVRSRYETALAFRIPGKIAARLVDTGALVKAGQVLARLDPADTALSATAAAAQLQLARADLQRYRDLRSKSFVSQAALDSKETAFKAALANAELARNQATYTVLRANQAGFVGLISAEVGQVVAAGQTVMRLARADTLEVAISIPEARMPEAQALDNAEVRLWADDEAIYRARLRELSPVADAVTRTYAARVAMIDADARVLVGMTAKVRFLSAQRDARLSVPLTALFQQDGQPALWVVQADQSVALRPVAVASYGEDTALLNGGVQAGERIVVAGVHKLTAGERVSVVEQPAPVATPASTSKPQTPATPAER
jgi:multidrug efflux system membrane fusion protein